ncbi:MAG TPA: tetratricopeptide repeat protein, partial [Bryobacteraceae bacterium]|nr:tetratricopeptide repeat protein [Bryobacteraceae bacterium]
DWQRQAVLKLAEVAVAQNNFTNAMAALEEFLTRFPDSSLTNLTLLTLGELSLRQFATSPAETNYLLTAQEIFDRLLATNSGAGDLAGKAYLDRGWCGWLAGKTNECLADFRLAAERLPLSEDLAVATFKTGDARFVVQDYSGARASYQSVLARFANWPRVMQSLGDRALYQIIRSSIKLRDLAGAEEAMRQLLKDHPKSELADNAQLLLGEGLSDFGSATNAVTILRDFEQRFPESTLRPQVELTLARTYEHALDWPAVITSYQDWLENFPTNDLRPQVEYALGRAEFQAGNETNALAAFAGFVTQFPTNHLAPLAQWWVADHFFRTGNWIGAETNYELIFQTPAWKSSALYFPAQLMAGRSAAGRQGYSDAERWFTAMTTDTNCPAELATQALFAFGSVLMRWDSPDTNRPFLNFERATNVFMKLCQDNSTNELGPLAWSELGDCNLQLGAFDAATSAYGQVINSPYASAGLRCRAQVGLGRVLEKMADLAPPDERKPLQNRALNIYLDVLYTDAGMADPFWAKKAGLLALPLMTT